LQRLERFIHFVVDIRPRSGGVSRRDPAAFVSRFVEGLLFDAGEPA
jgi:hypothetical protein